MGNDARKEGGTIMREKESGVAEVQELQNGSLTRRCA